ncbi:uncharacterized protein G2W53_005960 [Senna tora]|uniref:Uncharacterized protein n=1 Tax=Senna tora TaxID=362788 RepID=A0A834X4L3_9FABA|nr:uncharacterized protein G2W53_005960 [Senna tora]
MKGKKKKPNVDKHIRWEPPDLGFVKINVGASNKGDGNSVASCGGLARDEYGNGSLMARNCDSSSREVLMYRSPPTFLTGLGEGQDVEEVDGGKKPPHKKKPPTLTLAEAELASLNGGGKRPPVPPPKKKPPVDHELASLDGPKKAPLPPKKNPPTIPIVEEDETAPDGGNNNPYKSPPKKKPPV